MGILDSPDPIFETHADIPGRLTSLADSQKVGAREFNNLRTFANEVKALVMDAAKGNTALDTRVTAAEGTLSPLPARVTAVEGRATAVETRSTALENRTAGSVSVVEHGAAGDGTTDDTAAIQATIDAAMASGKDVVIPPGYYRVTGRLNVGLPEYDEYEFILNRTNWLRDSDCFPHEIAANLTANAHLPTITIRFMDGAYLVADFAPSVATPVLSYNLQGSAQKTGAILNPAIIGTESFFGGRYEQPSSGIGPTNNLIGVYASRGCKRVSRLFTSSIQHGFLSANAYWTRLTDLHIEYAAGDCVNLGQANAIKADNLLMSRAGRGLVFDGDASEVRGIHTQQVREDMTIIASDCCVFGPGYLEDTQETDGTGYYAVKTGTVANTTRITQTTFDKLRIGSVRPNKKLFRVYGHVNSRIVNCRSFEEGNPIDMDTMSGGVLDSNGFNPDTAQWPVNRWARLEGYPATPAWTSYDPTWGANVVAPDLGNGTLVGRFSRNGNIVHYSIVLTIGSTSTLGTGGWFLTLPVAVPAGADVLGSALAQMVASPYTQATGVSQAVAGSSVTRITFHGTGGHANATTPFAWAAGDILTASGWYATA